MNDQHRAQFRTRIEDRLAALDAEDALGAEGQATVQLDQQAVGRLSRMDALQNQAMARANHERRHQERARLISALKRLESRSFGFCEDCGDDIAQKRLEFDPATLRCIDCAKG